MLRVEDGRCAGRLPAEMTAFVGRTAELAQVMKLLGGSRLVTLIGTGGVGKTRLALRAASMSVGRYRHGVCLAELSDLRDPGLLGRTVAAALGVYDQDTKSGFDMVLDRLRGCSMLLILDNCEHLIDECATLAAAIMAEAAGVTLLATSRQPLDVPGEAVCPLAPLPVPSSSCDALDLFEQRAADVVPGFTLTDDNRADAIRLCRRLDGVPLAIELAAVRLRALPLRDLADRLEDRFQVLGSGRRVPPDRHQTLHSAIAWSYDLCSEAEQIIWARLSVFSGSFDIVSAERVCADGDMERDKVTAAIIGLVDKSVVLRERADLTRYRLLDTIREFGASKLAESGTQLAVRARHVARYFDAARNFQRNLAADDQMARLARLRLENANIRAALEYALDEPGRDEETAALADALYGYWQISGLLGEGRHWLGKVLSRFPRPGPERGRALIDSAMLGAFQGSPSAVREALDGTRIAQDIGHDRLAARGYLAQNIAFAFAGRYDEALAAGDEAERRLSTAGTPVDLVCLDGQMGLLLTLCGQFGKAAERCEQGLRRLAPATGERWLRSYFHGVLACALYHEGGKPRECAEFTRMALSAKFDIGDIVGGAFAFEVFAWLAADDGRGERAAWLFGAADALWRQTGSRVSNIPVLEQSHQRAARKVREAITADRFDTLFTDGATRPLSLVVARAVADADTLYGPDPAVPAPGAGAGAGAAIVSRGSVGPQSPLATLTRRESEIAALVSGGLSNREIAEKLVISRRTVDAHVDHIFTKLGISSRVHLAALLATTPPLQPPPTLR